jgi:hypothetical protein
MKIKNVILHFVLYCCGIWPLALREEHRLWRFENRMLRKIFGPKKEEVARCWRRPHNEELHNFYASPNMIKMINQGG